jgi:hypothetical protein
MARARFRRVDERVSVNGFIPDGGADGPGDGPGCDQGAHDGQRAALIVR